MPKCFIDSADLQKYEDEYVTLAYYASRTILTHHKIPIVAYNEAKELGYVNPIIVYIPKSDVSQIY